MGVRQNVIVCISKNIIKFGVQGWLPPHEVDDRRILDFWKELILKIIEFHGLARCFYRLFHVFVCKTVITG